MTTAERTQRTVEGRIWDAHTRLLRLTVQRNELIAGISPACCQGNIEKAYRLSEASTLIDVQINKTQADLELWKGLRDNTVESDESIARDYARQAIADPPVTCDRRGLSGSLGCWCGDVCEAQNAAL